MSVLVKSTTKSTSINIGEKIDYIGVVLESLKKPIVL